MCTFLVRSQKVEGVLKQAPLSKYWILFTSDTSLSYTFFPQLVLPLRRQRHLMAQLLVAAGSFVALLKFVRVCGVRLARRLSRFDQHIFEVGSKLATWSSQTVLTVEYIKLVPLQIT